MTDFSRFVKGECRFFSEKSGKVPQRTGGGGEKAVAFAGLVEYAIRDGHNREHDAIYAGELSVPVLPEFLQDNFSRMEKFVNNPASLFDFY